MWESLWHTQRLDQENLQNEGSENHIRVSVLIGTALSTAIMVNSDLILVMLGQTSVPLETGFLLLKNQGQQFWGSDALE